MADEKLKARLGLDNSEFKKGLKDSENQLSKMSAGFGRLGGAIAAAFSLRAIGNYLEEGKKLAATLEGVRAGFDNISTPGLLNNLRSATRGAVSDLKLMQTAVQASNFQIPLEKLASLLKFASARAIQTGQSVEYLTESIILGIGRKSPLILDNLGISAVRLREVLKGAGVEMSTVGDIASAVGKIATDELAKMGNVADSSATKMERFAVASEKLKTTWGDFINRELGPKREILTWWLQTMNDIFSDPNLTQLQKITMNPDKYIQYKKDRGYTDLDPLGKGMESTGGPLEQGTQIIQKRVDTIASLNGQLEAEKALLEQIDIADKKGIATQLQTIDALEKRIKNLKSLRQVNPMVDKLTVPKGYTDENFDPWKEVLNDYKEFQKIQNKLAEAPEYKKPIEDMTEALMLQGEAINILTNSFDTLFTSAENGFQNMVETMIDGMKRLVAEYLAKAVIFGLIRALFPGSELAVMATQNLWNMGIGGKATGGLGGFQSQPLNVNVVGSIRGKDIALALRRNG